MEAHAMKTHRDIEGYFNYEFLYAVIADSVPNGACIVEVGSWFGQSLAFMGQRLQARGWKGRLVAVDGFTGELNQPAHAAAIAEHGGTILSQFRRNMQECGIDDMIEVIVGDSANSAEHFDEGSVDFCYIDAAHDYTSVCRDIAAWLPKMKPGGILAGHDYQWHEVQRAVYERFAGVGYEVYGPCWVKKLPHVQP